MRTVRPAHFPGKICAYETLRNRHSTPGSRQHALSRAGPLRGHRLHPALGARAARHRSTGHFGFDRAARRERAGGRDRGDRRARGGALDDPGHPHTQQHLGGADEQHHPGIHARPPGGRGGAGRPRQGVARARAVTGRRARAGDREAVGRRAAVLLAGALQRQLRLDAAVRRRGPAGEGAAPEPAGCRQRGDFR